MRKTELKILGMTCSSCEVRIEQKWKKLPGIHKVRVNHSTGKAIITHSDELKLVTLQAALAQDGYRVTLWNQPVQGDEPENDFFDYLNVGAIFLILIAIYLITKELGLVPKNFGVSANMSYGFVFLIGLVAAVSSCLAVTGGLLLAVGSEWAERHPELTGWQKFKPLLSFNIGRLVFYGILGGVVGAIGSALQISPRTNAGIVIVAGLVMLFLGIHLLHLFPGAGRFIPKMPKFLAHKIHDFEKHDHPLAPFLLGGATFFLPCGFTQALQLYALSVGNWKVGALTMFVFALGTMPALLSVSALSSFIQGTVKKYFMRVAGALIVLIALLNIKSGLVLSGIDVKAWLPSAPAIESNVEMAEGKLIARMAVRGLSYTPSHFVIKKGIPVEWQIDGREAAGCARFVVMPQLKIQQLLEGEKITIVTFTPTQTGRLYFSCPMGMTTPWAAFEVIE
ncbi:MAG: sulfite exporter TauE/SafE family protein [Candidatus Peregrinibacteria bacterium]